MINFPVAGGTSGYLLGGTLAALILGSSWAGGLCITTVLIIQAVLFWQLKLIVLLFIGILRPVPSGCVEGWQQSRWHS